MKTFVLILAMLSTPLAAQNKQPQNTTPPQTTAQSPSIQISQTKAPSASAAQQPQTIDKPVAKPAQLLLPQQPIVFTAKQLNEYGNNILNQSEQFYNDRMKDLLWTMGILMGIGAVIVPLVVGVLLPIIQDRQRKISFAKEIAARLQELEGRSKEQMEEFKTELIKLVSSPLSMAFSGLGAVFSSQQSVVGYDLMLQAHVLSMKFSIIGQCLGGCLTADQIIYTFSVTDKGKELTLGTLEAVNGEIENMKGDLDKIVDAEKRVDMESQVKKLQIYVCALIHEKQQTSPPQAGPQEDEGT